MPKATPELMDEYATKIELLAKEFKKRGKKASKPKLEELEQIAIDLRKVTS